MSIRCSSNNCFNPSFPCSPWELVLQLFYSPFLFLDENLRIHRCRANGTHITPCGFIKVRLMHLLAIGTSDNEWLFVFHGLECPRFNILFGRKLVQKVSSFGGYSAHLGGSSLFDSKGLGGEKSIIPVSSCRY